MSPASNIRDKQLPACGKCGYPARGITTVHCPECGADLREVGIKRPGHYTDSAKMFVVALVYSTIFLVVSIVVWNVIDAQLPYIFKTNARIKLKPVSDQYDALVRIETEEKIWGGRAHKGGLDFVGGPYTHPPATPLNTSLTGLTPGMRTISLTITLAPATTPAGAWNVPELSVDPVTREAQWTGLQGNRYQGQGALTEQDMLAFLASAGADPNDPNVSSEAKQLHLLLEGLSQNKTQFTLTGFSSFGGGGGMGSSKHAGWYPEAFLLLAVALWIAGLALISKRIRGQIGTQTKLE